MKRILSIILSLIMLVSVIPMSALADNDEITPVIMISGFGATTLAIDGNAVFPPSAEGFKSAFGFDLTGVDALKDFLAFLKDKNWQERLSNAVLKIIDPIKMNDDGTSCYDVKPIVSGAKNTSLKAFKENDMLNYVPYAGSEFLDMESIGEKIGDENVFNFTYDWRLSNDTISDELDEYIQDVLELTGSNKVSIYSISQGSMLVGEYMYKYADKGQVDNAVFDTPIFCGSTMVSSFFESQELSLDYETIFDLLGNILHTQFDFTMISDAVDLSVINGAIDYGRNKLVVPAIATSPAFWEMVPMEDFERTSNNWLDKTKNARVFSLVNKIHNEFQSNIKETFEKATENGATISLKVCSGHTLVTNQKINSDAIVDVKYASGAVCADYGTTFPKDYIQAKDNGHYSISPSREIDASTCYWPERTWFVNQLYHGQVEWCPKSLALVEKLLYTHELKDVYSSFEFPQFMQCNATTNDIAIAFKCSNCCFLPTENSKLCGNTLVLTNLSKDASMFIKSAGVLSATLNLKAALPVTLGPGESIEIAVSANKSLSEDLYDTVEVEYVASDNVTETKIRDFGITVTNKYSGVIKNDTESATLVFIKQIIKRIVSDIKKIFSVFKELVI